MTKRLLSTLRSITAIIAVSVIQSCSKSETMSLLETVPADAQSVTIANVKNIALQSGCNISADGTIEPTEALEAILERGDVATYSLVKIICSNAPYIDTEKIVWFIPAKSQDFIVVFDIKDKDTLGKSLAVTSTAATKVSDYIVYAFPECSVVVHGDIGWIARDAKSVIEIRNHIGKDHFATFNPVKEFLESEPHDLVSVYNNSSNTRSELQYILSFANFKSGGIFAEFSFMNAQGNYYHFNQDIHEVERDLLKYVPSQTQILLAIGRVDDWSKIFEILENNLPADILAKYGLYYHLSKETIQNINGTSLVALAPFAGAQSLKQISPETWQILFMSHLPEEETDRIISMGRELLSGQGIRTGEVSEGIYNCKFGTEEYMFGETDGYIFASNYDIFEGGNTDLSPAYESKRAVIELLVPNGSETMKALGLPWGIDLNLSLNSSNAMIVFRLPGAKGPALKELLEYMATGIRR